MYIASGRPARLDPLLDRVMAELAQGLPVRAVPEQGLIALVRGDVIHH
jgi:hypothetical protein